MEQFLYGTLWMEPYSRFSLFAVFTRYIQRAVNPLTTVLTVAAIPHASANRFPNLSFITLFPDDLSLYRKVH